MHISLYSNAYTTSNLKYFCGMDSISIQNASSLISKKIMDNHTLNKKKEWHLFLIYRFRYC